ncbi:YbjQ family protein [Arthrobacter sunyaminii]|uniref:YbjQ family protein n=1 Tax=Arthrobacter sunyaminii TaxID=2816859 RepID=UPI001A950ADC|nr:heavy metal-binding domain-containing protein [Arthrobacter sunyaminii]MBO0896110.1 heavy metal-binding domain-containing protein [Arthrobacter sunyaminii]
MKARDIAKNHGLDVGSLENWLRQSNYPHKSGLTGVAVPDDVTVGDLVADYNRHLVEKQTLLAQEEERVAKEHESEALAAKEKQQALASILITSGFSFEGYSITKYSGYISGDDAVSMDRPRHGWLMGVQGEVGADLLAGLAHIRRNALAELKEAAYALGCNAVIGVDFDYLTLDPETATSSGGTMYLPFLFAVTANGNAVVIEKN